MTRGFLVNPDLPHRPVEFELETAAEFPGSADGARVSVAFQEDGSTYAAFYNSEARARGAHANPVASLGHREVSTGDSAFFTGPTTAICGPVIFTGAGGQGVGEVEIERIKDGIRAAKNYRDDSPQEFLLWRNAVYNLRDRDLEIHQGSGPTPVRHQRTPFGTLCG